MKLKLRLFVVLLLVVSLLLSGCTAILLKLLYSPTAFTAMTYTRPDMDTFASVLEESCTAALEQTDLTKLVEQIYAFNDAYDNFYTNYNLAFIHYCTDMTDTYWETEYTYCATQYATVSAGLDRFYRALAKSPLRAELETDAYFGEDYFISFDGESLYDAYMTQLLEQESALITQYQALSGEASSVSYYSEEYFSIYGIQMEEIFVQLVLLRQEMAAYAGYSSYLDFAYDFYYVRDYTPEQAISYMADVRAELVPLYTRLKDSGFWNREWEYVSEADMLQYVSSMASNMGGTISNAFSQMKRYALYDISYSENKYSASFEVYLSGYYSPYVFVSPVGYDYDKLTFAHEFGHFCCDYATLGGSYQGVDVAEVFSQGMEYLSLFYADGGQEMAQLKMADCLCTYVEQSAYASFEHQVYEIEPEGVTVESVRALYAKVCTDYGMTYEGWDSRDYVCIPHFFQSPLYVISYVLSNDAALQIYEMEASQQGSGLACYEANMTSTQSYLLSFLEEAGMESPFDTGRINRVKQTLEEILFS